ncbi:MAG: type II toxin-antitoxin system RelE/ParE family toxin [Dehalococcoidia bacterium]|nr:type II toxin-antitoxin system RelE/ParE family toxin [Dehalococcoidia bacterium]
MPYRVEISPAAERNLRAISAAPREILARAIYALGDELRPIGVRKIRGAQNAWRIRVWDFHIVYEVCDDRSLVLIIKVDRRRERTYRRI